MKYSVSRYHEKKSNTTIVRKLKFVHNSYSLRMLSEHSRRIHDHASHRPMGPSSSLAHGLRDFDRIRFV
jgi:hypothetical protein